MSTWPTILAISGLALSAALLALEAVIIKGLMPGRRPRSEGRATATIVGVSTANRDGSTLYVIALDQPAEVRLRDKVTIGWSRP